MGGTPGEVVDSDGGVETFSMQHADEIAKDCAESVTCAVMRDEPLEEDPLAECLRDTAAALDNASSDVRMRFLVNVERCRESSACQYYDCAIAGS
jgi:hypothetical protein